MPTKKVFLSSTARDLEEYREAAYRAIEGLDGYHCGRMEDFGARDWDADDFCRAEVVECDLFVGILGHLYGSCPEGSEKSYTEREYDAAVEAGKPRLMFVAPKDFPVPADLIESDEKRKKQRSFRERVNKNRMRADFKSPDNLALSVTQAIRNNEYKNPAIEKRASNAPFQAPPLPEHFIPRPETSGEVKGRLLTTNSDRSGVLVVSALHGLGGIGKTILATSLAHDEEVRSRFSDGILWATLGQEPDLLSLLITWIQELGDYKFRPTTIDSATTHLRTLLHNSSTLLVVDDAWNVVDVKPFLVGGSHCQVLITTRDSLIADAVGAKLCELDVMTKNQSLELLATRLRRNLEDKAEKDLALALAETVGYLPLALELAASQVEDGVPWIDLLKALREEVARLEALEMPGLDEIDEATRRHLSLKACFKLSLQLLPKQMMKNFPWLGVFPEDVLLNKMMLATLWETDEEIAQKQLRHLRKKSLLMSGPPLNQEVPTYRLHDLVHDLARNLIIDPIEPSKNGDLPGLGLELQDAHAILLERYRKKTKDNLWHKLTDDGYIHAHLLWHLEKSKRYEDIHALLKEENEEFRNAWYETRDRLGQTGGFIEDVARAWRLIEVRSEAGIENSMYSSVKIDLEARYSLITASVNSLASNLPSNLLVSMVKMGLWTVAQGLAYARRVPDLDRRDETLRQLYLCIPNPQEALSVAREINDELLRSRALLGIALNMSESQKNNTLKEALEISGKIRDEDRKAQIQADIASNLIQFNEALEVARKIRRVKYRSEALARIASNSPNPQEALSITKEIEDEGRKADALASIATYLPENILEDAIQLAKGIGDDYMKRMNKNALKSGRKTKTKNKRYVEKEAKLEALAKSLRSKALAGIALNSPNIKYSLEVAREIEDKYLKEKALARIAANLPNHQDALAVAKEIEDEGRRAEALTRIAGNLPNHQDALAVAKEIRDEERRAEALVRIAENLTNHQDALAVAKEIVDEERRAEALIRIAANLPDYQDALTIVRKIDLPDRKAEGLITIALNLPYPQKTETIKEAISTINIIDNGRQKAEMLARIAADLPEDLLIEALRQAYEIENIECRSNALFKIALNLSDLQHALEVAREIKVDELKAEALAKIAIDLRNPQKTETFKEALAIVSEIRNEALRAKGLANITSNMPMNLQSEALQVVREIGDENQKKNALLGIASNLTGNLLEDALAIARDFKNRDRKAETLIKIAPTLLSPQEMLDVTRVIGNEDWRIDVLSRIESDLIRDIFKDTYEIARKIGDENSSEEYLAKIAPKVLLPNEMLKIAKLIRNKRWRIEALAGIASNIPKSQGYMIFREALQITSELDEDRLKAEMLVRILPDLSKHLFDEALEIARGIEDRHWRAEALAKIAPNQSDPQKKLEVAREIEDDNLRNEVLSKIAPNLTDPKQRIEMAKEIGDERWRAEALVNIASTLPDPLLKDTIQMAKNISYSHWRIKALSGIAPHIQEPHKSKIMKDARKMIQEIGEEHWKAESLAWITFNLSIPIDAFETAKEIRKVDTRAEVLAKISTTLPEPLKKEALKDALDAARKISKADRRAEVLAKIAPIMSEPQKKEALKDALEAARDIKVEERKANALAEIAHDLLEPQKAKALEDALECARKIGDYHQRAEILAKIANPLAELPINICYPLVRDTLHILAQRTRRDFLSDLASLTPIILTLGGQNAFKETVSSIQDATRWWP